MAPPRKDGASASGSSKNAPQATITLNKTTVDELENKRDAFVTAMNTLSYAAQTAARTGFDYFNLLSSASGLSAPNGTNAPIGDSFNAHLARAMSVAPQEQANRVRTPAAAANEDGGDGGEPVKKKRKRNVKPRDPDEPKKPLSAYMQFSMVARPIIRQDMGADFSGRDLVAEAGARWKALSPEEKQIWANQHVQQMIKWYQDLNAYRASKGLDPEPVPDHYKPGATAQSIPEEELEATDGAHEENGAEEEVEEQEATPPPPAKRARGGAKANGRTAPQAKGKGRAAAPAVVATPEKKKRGAPVSTRKERAERAERGKAKDKNDKNAAANEVTEQLEAESNQAAAAPAVATPAPAAETGAAATPETPATGKKESRRKRKATTKHDD
ncbi:hypothetical protein BDZ91DRAFT_353653 [Kalaharituber pfeilii]|nr:hypothetical protein BDZ91DRAFT_353653 [Kalaharituber pfeilii]